MSSPNNSFVSFVSFEIQEHRDYLQPLAEKPIENTIPFESSEKSFGSELSEEEEYDLVPTSKLDEEVGVNSNLDPYLVSKIAEKK